MSRMMGKTRRRLRRDFGSFLWVCEGSTGKGTDSFSFLRDCAASRRTFRGRGGMSRCPLPVAIPENSSRGYTARYGPTAEQGKQLTRRRSVDDHSHNESEEWTNLAMNPHSFLIASTLTWLSKCCRIRHSVSLKIRCIDETSDILPGPFFLFLFPVFFFFQGNKLEDPSILVSSAYFVLVSLFCASYRITIHSSQNLGSLRRVFEMVLEAVSQPGKFALRTRCSRLG